jgi:hypothetical protein
MSLSPSVADLRTFAPKLAAWLTGAGKKIDPPSSDLGLGVLVSGSNLQAPAPGVVSWFVAGARTRQWTRPDGKPAFDDGHLIVALRLLPEVEVRLAQIAATQPGMIWYPVRWVVADLGVVAPADLIKCLLPASTATPPPTPQVLAETLGLALSTGATPALVDGAIPMTALCLAGDPLLASPSTSPWTLWCFDRRGSAIDPGSVCAAMNALRAVDSDLTEGDTTEVVDWQGLHLVDAHEGPITTALLQRLEWKGNPATAALNVGSGTLSLRVGAADDSPVRLAQLPTGTFGTASVTVPSTGRCYRRVAVVDVERHLVGVPRAEETDSGFEAAQCARQADADRRVRVAQSTIASPFLATADEVAGRALLLAGAASRPHVRVLATNADPGWGPAARPAPAETSTLAAPQITAVAAWKVSETAAVLEITLSGGTGAWIRAWPGFVDRISGRRIRGDGGSGRIHAVSGGAPARALVWVPLPAPITGAAYGFDLLITDGLTGFALGEHRAEVADAIGTGSGGVWSCEQGAADASGPGEHGVQAATTKGWVAATLGASGRDLGAKLGAADLVHGCPVAGAWASAVDSLTPNVAGVPFGGRNLGQQSLDTVLARATGIGIGFEDAAAVIGSAPWCPEVHELLPHRFGHPGAPGSVETHGAGVEVGGPAADLVWEHVIDRTAGHQKTGIWNGAAITGAMRATPWLLADPVPVSSTSPGARAPWIASLRTVAAGCEGEGQALAAIGAASGLFNSIPASAPKRLLMRRKDIATSGAREGADALYSALGRAQDLVYIETPALDLHDAGADTSDPLADAEERANAHLPRHPIGALVARLGANPRLHAILCVPIRPWAAVAPLAHEDARDRLLTTALLALGDFGERVVVFAPAAGAGRSMRLASTVVVVDDCWAMVGTTHLWRRGLAYDASLAVAVFDPALVEGRPAAITSFRKQSLADRLGVAPGELPLDPPDLVAWIRKVREVGGLGRLAVRRRVSNARTGPELHNPGTDGGSIQAAIAALAGDGGDPVRDPP